VAGRRLAAVRLLPEPPAFLRETRGAIASLLARIFYAARMDTAKLADNLEVVVIGAVGLTARALAEAAPGYDLTFPQWRALLVIGANDDGARVGEVAGRVGVTLPATSRLLRRLARRGLLDLATDPADRRATRARLTSRGEEVRAAILAYRRVALREMAAGIASSERGDPGAVEGLAVAVAALADAFGGYA